MKLITRLREAMANRMFEGIFQTVEAIDRAIGWTHQQLIIPTPSSDRTRPMVDWMMPVDRYTDAEKLQQTVQVLIDQHYAGRYRNLPYDMTRLKAIQETLDWLLDGEPMPKL